MSTTAKRSRSSGYYSACGLLRRVDGARDADAVQAGIRAALAGAFVAQ